MIQLSLLLSAEALHRYDSHGDPAYSHAEQLLRAMRWFDWCSWEDVCDALDLGINSHSHMTAMVRLIDRGRVERVGTVKQYRYRLRADVSLFRRVKCQRCPSANVAGKSMCQRHLDWERNYKQRKRAA